MSNSKPAAEPNYSTLEHNPDAGGQYAEDLPLGYGNAEVAHQPPGQYAEHLPLGGGNAEAYVQTHNAGNSVAQPVPKQEYAPQYGGGASHTPMSSAPPYPGAPNHYGKGVESQEKQPKPERICGMSKKMFWIVFAAIAVVVIIAAALGGGLGASLGKNKSEKSSSNNASTSSSGSATSTSVAPYPTATTADYTGLRHDSGLASLAFSGGVNGPQFAVYYQDENNYIKQSFFNTSLNTWQITTLNYAANTDGAKAGSALGAAATGINNTYQLEVFYVDDSNRLHELWYRQDSSSWGRGYTDGQAYEAHPQSKLAVIWDDCVRPLCSGDLMWLWQDSDENIRLGNSTSTVGLVDAVIVPSDDVPAGTGFAISAFGVASEPQNYQFFYQGEDSNLHRLMWQPGAVNDTTNSTGQGWDQSQTLGPLTGQGYIASYAYGRSLPSYNPADMKILNTFENGINVTSWDGADNEWTGSSTPGQLNGVTDYAPIATDTERQVFGIRNGTIQWFSVDDAGAWTYNGNVPTR